MNKTIDDNANVLLEKEGYIGYVTFNRPDKLNAFTWQMYGLVSQFMDALEDDDSIRVIVIRGAGKSFSAGFDMNEPGINDHVELRKRYDRIAHAARLKIWKQPKPTIAQIHGHCLGGAHDIALACDIAIASEDAVLGVPEIQFGMGTPFLLMPWVIGLRKTKELLLTGKTITGIEAERIGIVNYAVPSEYLERKVLEISKELATVPTPSIQLQKRGINRAIEMSGFATATECWLDLSCLGSLWNSPDIDDFNSIVAKDGFKAALKWRSEKFG